CSLASELLVEVAWPPLVGSPEPAVPVPPPKNWPWLWILPAGPPAAIALKVFHGVDCVPGTGSGADINIVLPPKVFPLSVCAVLTTPSTLQLMSERVLHEVVYKAFKSVNRLPVFTVTMPPVAYTPPERNCVIAPKSIR